MARNMYRKRIGAIFNDYKIFGYEESRGSGWVEFGVLERDWADVMTSVNLRHLESLGAALGTLNIDVTGQTDLRTGEHYVWVTAYDVVFGGAQ